MTGAEAGADITGLLRSRIRDIPDYPQPGIVFKDITPLLADGPAFAAVVAELGAGYQGVHKVAGIEARGFILAAPVALELKVGFVPVRKQGKLPAATYAQSYDLEYGIAAVQDTRQRVESPAGTGCARWSPRSLELGIDIGPVELVVPDRLAAQLRYVPAAGRAGPTTRRSGIPAGRLYPTSRDELVECAALLRGARSGLARRPAWFRDCPLDILAQQVVAECAAADWAEDDLLALVRGRARRSRRCPREDFDDVAELVSEGIRTGRGRRARLPAPGPGDRRLRGRRGARLAALTSGGAIPGAG